jgi:mRNA interferase RelE/StbE
VHQTINRTLAAAALPRVIGGPQYRLHVGEVRVFYDVSGATVEILAIVAKSEAEGWLRRFGNPP